MYPHAIRVLLIEDSLSDAQVIREILKEIVHIDFELTHSMSLQKGLHLLQQGSFDLLLLDLTLPDSSGEETFQRATKYAPHIPIVILSSLSDDFISFQAIKEGIQDYLIKGKFDSDDLLRSIRYSIERKKAELELLGLNQKLQKWLDYKSHELEESRENYHSLVQALPDIVFKLNPKGYFIFINDSIKTLGYSPGELIGEHFSKIIHPKEIDQISRDSVLPRYKGKATGPEKAPKLFDERRGGDRKTVDLEVRLIRKDGENLIDDSGMIGSVIAFGEISSRGQYEGEPSKEMNFLGTVGIIRDITHRKRTERTFKHIAQGTLGVVGEEFFSSLVRHISLSLQVDFVVVAKWENRMKSTMVTLGLWSDEELKGNQSFFVKGSVFEKVMDSKDLCYHPENFSDLYPKTPLMIEKDSFLAIPIDNRTAESSGFLAIANRGVLHEEKQAKSILSIFAARVAAEMERLRAEAEVQYRVELELLIATIAKEFILLPFHQIDEAIESSLEKIGSFVQVDRVQIYLYSNDPKVLEKRHGWSRDSSRATPFNTLELSSFPWLQGQMDGLETIQIGQASNLPPEAHPEKEKFQSAGIGSFIAVPLIYGGEKLGLLAFDSFDPTEGWPMDVIVLMILVGEIFSHALERKTRERERREIEYLKSQFLSVVNHELRTPLTSIYGSLKIFQDRFCSGLSEQGRQFIDITLRNCEQLKRMVEDLLIVQKVQEQQLTLEIKQVKLRSEIDRAIDSCRYLLEPKKICLQIESSLPEGAEVLADPLRLCQVLTNILSNAIKYSRKGERVDIDISSEGTLALVKIQDRGKGIPEGLEDKIFENFFQADSSSTRKFGGIGMGLSSAKLMIEQMGGRIGVKSEPEKGCIFHFTVPLVS